MEFLFVIAAEVAGEAAAAGLSTVIVSAVSAVIAGLGVKILDWILNRKNVQVDEATQIRLELRTQVKQLADRYNEMSESRDYWKERYYDLYNSLQSVRLELEKARLIISEYERNKE